MKKIIIVEDDPMLADLYKMKFSMSDFEVFMAKNGKEAIGIAKKENVDVVLTDLIMPEMDGYEMTKILRSGEYNPNIKIIIFSNMDQQDSEEKFAGFKVDGFVMKSKYTPSEMLEEVKKIINK